MILRVEDIQSKMLHLIGWKQSYDSSDGSISENLTVSESGLYYQDMHPLITLENLRSIAPDFANMSYPYYQPFMTYDKGIIVQGDNSKYYKSKKHVPDTVDDLDDTEYWELTNPFSEWLEAKTKASIIKAITRYVNEKIVKKTYNALCENKTLFDGTGRIYDLVKNKNNLVGFEVIPIRAKGVTTKINRIGLQFSEPGEYTIFIMHSSMTGPYYKETFIRTEKNSMEWFKPQSELYLPYESDKIDAGGSWYICYLQKNLPNNSQAIRKSRDWSKGPCNECSRHEYETWRIWSKYLEVHPFYVNGEFVEEDEEDIKLWDIENNFYDYSTNYGLNLDISVVCDITDFIISQKMMFQDYIGKSLAVDFLREFAYNPNVRTNRHSINASRPDILYEIDGDSSSMKKAGLSYQLELALKAIQISTEGLDRVCLLCANNGLKYRVV